MPGYHANETSTAEFRANSTGNTNSLVESPPNKHDLKSNFDQLSHEPLPEIEEKVYSLVQGACLTQMALILAVRDWVKKELIPRHLQEGQITEAPSEYSRAYFPTKEDIRSMARRAIVQQRSSLLDQDAVEDYLLEAKKHQKIDFYLYKAPRNRLDEDVSTLHQIPNAN